MVGAITPNPILIDGYALFNQVKIGSGSWDSFLSVCNNCSKFLCVYVEEGNCVIEH